MDETAQVPKTDAICHGPIPTSPSTKLQDHKARYLHTMPNHENKNEQTAEGV